MDNAADRKDVRRREKQAAQADRLRAEQITMVMSTPAGRQWLWDILASCHVFTTTFTADPLTSAFNEGQRSIGLALLADILRACPDQYIQAMRESHERHSIDERRSSPIADGGDPGSVPGDADAGSEDAGWYTDAGTESRLDS